MKAENKLCRRIQLAELFYIKATGTEIISVRLCGTKFKKCLPRRISLVNTTPV